MTLSAQNKRKEAGFALLMSLIVVSVILSVGITILDISLKQINLSTNAKESEIAFHAANAGAECARYMRTIHLAEIKVAADFVPDCFGVAPSSYVKNILTKGAGQITGDGLATQYQYEFDWGTEPRCTYVNKIVAVADPSGGGFSVDVMETLIPGYPYGNVLDCDAGSICTTISVLGYNKSCATVGAFGTVQREVLLQF